MNDIKAFLLLEAVLAISVLSLGLVFVVRSIDLCMKTARTSFNYSQATNLAYEKMFELELVSQEDGIERYSSEGKFSDNRNFDWEYKVEDLE
ncbi:MAG: hypothetical protein PHG69_01390, partial [Candidatus Omnitrophica bacterium]|nr:hypothetical protein [Candidatus Omnitrophota bacterium]